MQNRGHSTWFAIMASLFEWLWNCHVIVLNFRGFLSLTLLLETSFMSQVIVCERRGLFPYKCLNWIKSKCFSNFWLELNLEWTQEWIQRKLYWLSIKNWRPKWSLLTFLPPGNALIVLMVCLFSVLFYFSVHCAISRKKIKINKGNLRSKWPAIIII